MDMTTCLNVINSTTLSWALLFYVNVLIFKY